MRREIEESKVGDLVTQLIVVIGAAVFVRGVWMAWRPGGWMVAGFFVMVPAVFVAYGNYRGKN